MANHPVSNAKILSPGESVLTKAASQAPVPEDGNITIGPWVLKIGLSWLRISRVNSGKFGPLWSMTASDIALRTLSGTFDGPGIWRKCLPAGWITLLIFTFLFLLNLISYLAMPARQRAP